MFTFKLTYLSFIALASLFPIGYFSLLLVGSIHQAYATCPTDITGIWTADDGGTYYIKENNRHIWWAGGSGFNPGTGFTNVFDGHRESDGSIQGIWVDVPLGNTRSNGALTLHCDQDALNDKLTKISATGGFGGNEWTKPKQIIKWHTSWEDISDGDCYMWQAYLSLYSDGTGVWHADVTSDSDGDSWIIKKITITDAAGKPIFVIPKFSSPTLLQGPLPFASGKGPAEDKIRVWNYNNIHFPFEIFNSIKNANMAYSC